mmetsp:Transcript_11490/g.49063  ORF Transcript_11490/g.49063 Transcript_11490/m.49063 type:complete len:673 (+) Transcript_11490:610-2628(+)
MSESRSLSSKEARNVPSSVARGPPFSSAPFATPFSAAPALTAFLTVPRMPETVRSDAPSNLATSSALLNMPVMNAVFLYTLEGVPTSLSFFITFMAWSTSNTTAVAAMRKLASLPLSVWKHTTPVFCGTIGPYTVAWQCMCSGVYLIMRWREFASCIEYTGSAWYRRHPTENTSGSWFFKTFLCHRCFFRRSCWYPMASSDANRPPTSKGRHGSKFSTHSRGTPFNTRRRYEPGRYPSRASRVASGIASSSRLVLAIWSCISPFTRSKYDAGSSSSAPFAPRPNPPLPFFSPEVSFAKNASFLAIFSKRRASASESDPPSSPSDPSSESASASESASSSSSPFAARSIAPTPAPNFSPVSRSSKSPYTSPSPSSSSSSSPSARGCAAERSAAADQSPVTNRFLSSGASRSSASRTSPRNFERSNASSVLALSSSADFLNKSSSSSSSSSLAKRTCAPARRTPRSSCIHGGLGRVCAAAAMRICDTTVSRTYASAVSERNASDSREEPRAIHSETVGPFWRSAGTLSSLSSAAPFVRLFSLSRGSVLSRFPCVTMASSGSSRLLPSARMRRMARTVPGRRHSAEAAAAAACDSFRGLSFSRASTAWSTSSASELSSFRPSRASTARSVTRTHVLLRECRDPGASSRSASLSALARRAKAARASSSATAFWTSK